jgi:rhodanese-related sulfurtransferase
MFSLKSLFGPSTNYSELIENGAVIIDVRSKGEYSQGHIKGSSNIPLDSIQGQIEKLKKKNQVVITCCASGMRSGSAKSILAQNGIEAYNGGGWRALQGKL